MGTSCCTIVLTMLQVVVCIGPHMMERVEASTWAHIVVLATLQVTRCMPGFERKRILHHSILAVTVTRTGQVRSAIKTFLGLIAIITTPDLTDEGPRRLVVGTFLGLIAVIMILDSTDRGPRHLVVETSLGLTAVILILDLTDSELCHPVVKTFLGLIIG